MHVSLTAKIWSVSVFIVVKINVALMSLCIQSVYCCSKPVRSFLALGWHSHIQRGLGACRPRTTHFASRQKNKHQVLFAGRSTDRTTRQNAVAYVYKLGSPDEAKNDLYLKIIYHLLNA